MTKEPKTTPQHNKAVQDAIKAGVKIIEDGKPKIEAAMIIYKLIHKEPQEVIVQAFIEGASLTPKGALTYWYNCRRKLKTE